MENKSKWSESHPVAYALIVMAASIALAGIAVWGVIIVDLVATMVMYGSLDHVKVNNLGLGNTGTELLGFVIVLLLFWLIFRKDLRGFFNVRRFGVSLLLGWSILVATAFILLSSILEQDYGNFGAALLMGMRPGIGEEVLFRVIPICLVMRSKDRERLIVPAIAFTSILFGMVHGINIFSGADPISTLFQITYASCIGFLFAVIYLKTGNMWITMFLHTIMDTASFLSASTQSEGGVLTQGVDVASVVFLLVCTVLFFANAFSLFRKTSKAEILDTWSGIWKSEA
jgi:uncharacterized protein